jgi:hypothetical protein
MAKMSAGGGGINKQKAVAMAKAAWRLAVSAWRREIIGGGDIVSSRNNENRSCESVKSTHGGGVSNIETAWRHGISGVESGEKLAVAA